MEKDFRIKDPSEIDSNRREIESKFKDFFNDSRNIIIVQNEKTITTNKIDYGVLIFHAIWSGPSIMIGKRILTDLIKYTNQGLKIYIIDIDTVTEKFKREYLGQLAQGYSESIFIDKGVIKAMHLSQIDLIPFITYVSQHCEEKSKAEKKSME